MLERLQGNEPLKTSIRAMLAAKRLTHSVLLVGEPGVGKGFAARCIAADYLYPAGGAPAEALLRGECCKATAKAGKRDSGRVETGVVREAISVEGAGSGGNYLVGQVMAMRSEIFNTSLSAEGRAVLLYHVEHMNEESANALLKVMEEPPEGVLFLLTADSLAGVLPTIRSRCVSFAVAPVDPAVCAAYCAKRGVAPKEAAMLAEVFDGQIGTVLAAAQSPARRECLAAARQLAEAAASHDAYTAGVLLAPYEKDKAGATALLCDFAALAAAGLRQSKYSPLQGQAAQKAIRAANEACMQLGANQNAKLVLTVLAMRLGRV
jgi:DNA polymerase-3 subunit delta'